MALFEDISNAMADTVEAASKGVVRVEARKRLPATGIIWRENVIVSAHHVIRKDDNISVGLPDGSVVTANLVGRDPDSDIAVLRVEQALTPLPLAQDGSLRVGHLALAVGKPGEHVQTTLGVVSALGTGQMDGLIQTDVVMYPGFSGGPLVDASGRVQGMNTSGFNRGASIAIATKKINQVVETLLTHGRMKKGYLGVGAQPVRLPEKLAGEIGQETGLMLASVEAGSPGEQGGLLQGDIIVAVDGQPTPHLDALLMLLGGDRVGKTIPVKIVRGGQVQDVTVTVGEKA